MRAHEKQKLQQFKPNCYAAKVAIPCPVALLLSAASYLIQVAHGKCDRHAC